MITPYDLVVSWGEDKELIYFGFGHLSPNEVCLTIYHNSFECNYNSLSKIEALGTDFDSVLRKYFRARHFHKRWRYINRQPLHSISIRSARLWYDASAKLVQLSPSLFRIDEEVKEIIVDYENRAEQNNDFKKRYSKYARVGYISGIDQQILALDYAFIGKIPNLIAKGQLLEAKRVNSFALEALSNESPLNQKIILRYQGINVKLLENNANYMDTLSHIRNSPKL